MHFTPYIRYLQRIISINSFELFFLAFIFCRLCVVICFFHYFLILIPEKEPVFPLTRELLIQVPFLLRLWYDAVLDWGLNPGPPALEASTLPLGYRGGGSFELIV